MDTHISHKEAARRESVVRNYDLLIIGAGPAGLSAAINGASEGLKVCLIDAGNRLGGQAKESHRIENYPMPDGFHEGVTGERLISGFIAQAIKFAAEILCPIKAHSLHIDGATKIITTDDYQEFAAKAVILSNGLAYRKHSAHNIGPLMGRGVYYGLPSLREGPLRNCTVIVVGGANSAGQAVMRLSMIKNLQIKLIIRKKLTDQMSKYLIDRILEAENVEVIENCEVVSCCGRNRLEAVMLKYSNGDTSAIKAQCMYFFIGAVPHTLWLRNSIKLDKKNFILTGHQAETGRNDWLPNETNLDGVFAAGDVRADSTKRIAFATGDGATALAQVHSYFARIEA
jgi:thioredoxin reductase (NADPH)